MRRLSFASLMFALAFIATVPTASASPPVSVVNPSSYTLTVLNKMATVNVVDAGQPSDDNCAIESNQVTFKNEPTENTQLAAGVYVDESQKPATTATVFKENTGETTANKDIEQEVMTTVGATNGKQLTVEPGSTPQVTTNTTAAMPDEVMANQVPANQNMRTGIETTAPAQIPANSTAKIKAQNTGGASTASANQVPTPATGIGTVPTPSATPATPWETPGS